MHTIRTRVVTLVAGALALTALGCGGAEDDAASGTQATAGAAPTAVVEPTPDPEPTATAIPPDPTPTSEPTPSPTPTAVVDEWEETQGWSGGTDGIVRALFFEPAFRFEAPADAALLCPPGLYHAGVSAAGFIRRVGPIPAAHVPAGLLVLNRQPLSIDTEVAALIEGFASPTDPRTVSVGGALGLTFDALAPEDAETLYDATGGDCTAKFDLAESWRLWVLDVDGTPVTMALFAPRADFERYAAELQPVVDSIEWRALLGG